LPSINRRNASNIWKRNEQISDKVYKHGQEAIPTFNSLSGYASRFSWISGYTAIYTYLNKENIVLCKKPQFLC
jgi:hypothetical protein